LDLKLFDKKYKIVFVKVGSYDSTFFFINNLYQNNKRIIDMFSNHIHNKILSYQQSQFNPIIAEIQDSCKYIASEENNQNGYFYPVDLNLGYTIEAGFPYSVLLCLFVAIGLGFVGYQFIVAGLYSSAVLMILAIAVIIYLIYDRIIISMLLGAFIMNFCFTMIIKEMTYRKKGYDSIKKTEQDMLDSIQSAVK
jgi:hypothetical protein